MFFLGLTLFLLRLFLFLTLLMNKIEVLLCTVYHILFNTETSMYKPGVQAYLLLEDPINCFVVNFRMLNPITLE